MNDYKDHTSYLTPPCVEHVGASNNDFYGIDPHGDEDTVEWRPPTPLTTKKMLVSKFLEFQHDNKRMEQQNIEMAFEIENLEEESSNISSEHSVLVVEVDAMRKRNLVAAANSAEKDSLAGDAIRLQLVMSELENQLEKDDREIHKIYRKIDQIVREKQLLNLDKHHFQHANADASNMVNDMDTRRQNLECCKEDTTKTKIHATQIKNCDTVVRVYVRFRPCTKPDNCVSLRSEDTVTVTRSQTNLKQTVFQFNRVLRPQTTQAEVFHEFASFIPDIMKGRSLCLITYGGPAAGKTFTLFGNERNPGLATNIFQNVFSRLGETQDDAKSAPLKISLLQIQNNTLTDTLTGNALKLRDSGGEVAIAGLVEEPVHTWNDAVTLFNIMRQRRRKNAHAIVLAKMQPLDVLRKETSNPVVVILCDLCAHKSGFSVYRNMDSLSCLEKVFVAIKNKSKSIPFRESKLTHFLKPCLMGGAICCIILNTRLESEHINATLKTLRFGVIVKEALV